MLNQLKLTNLAITICASAFCLTAQNTIDNALVYNNGNETASITTTTQTINSTEAVVASSTNVLDMVTLYTAVEDITLKNYFNLAGFKVMPYMQIADADNSFDPERVEMNTVQFAFTNKTVEYLVDGKIYEFEISNIDHYVNNAPNCLIKAKIALQGKPMKVNKEKISEISIYVDRNDHISFIEIGETEYYLRP
ncbi:MAG: hypothetical protein WAU21_00465 [Chitinophagales bacterium]